MAEHSTPRGEEARTAEALSGRTPDDSRIGADSIDQDMERLLADVHGGHFGVAGSSPSRLRPQEASLGRYVVLDVIGSGGMGTVLKAYDDQLDRAVAIKLLHPGAARRQAGRLRREAQALAKLSHPNVVHVYEVGEADGQWYIAMELVSGSTLRQWQAERRGWRECVAVYLQAGAGLAAAHRAGLVHRDFKPDNCIIDEQERPRVLDFGLVRETDLVSREESPESIDEPSGSLVVSRTEAGAVVGTPAYMSLEQLQGRPADERSDQFGFCASLYEGLYGERPFDGRTTWELEQAQEEGVGRPPSGVEVPAGLRAVVLRGLASEPDERWPSMDALLVELRRFVVPRARRWLGLGVAAGLTALGIGVGVGAGQVAEVTARCTGAQAELEGAWDEERRRAVRDSILGTELAYAPDTWTRVERRLDDYGAAWVTAHTEACEATTVRREQSEEAMDLRMACLRRRRTALSAAVKALSEAEADADAGTSTVEHAVKLVVDLPGLDACDDVERLREQRQRVPPPEDPQVEREVEALRETLADIDAELRTGRYAHGLARVDSVVAQAEALGYPPLVAEVKALRGEALDRNGQYAEAGRELEAAYSVAAEHGHDAVAVEAMLGLVWVVGVEQADHAQGLWWGRAALPLTKGLLDDPLAEARALGQIGVVLSEQGKLDESLAHHRRVLAMSEEVLGPDDLNVAAALNNIGTGLQQLGTLEEALVVHRRALSIRQASLGPQHPSVGASLNNIGNVLGDLGRLEESLVEYRRGLAVLEKALGPQHPNVAYALANIGNLLQGQDKLEEALSILRRTSDIFETALGPSHPNVAVAQLSIGNTLYRQGELDKALEHQLRALGILEEALGPGHANVASTLLGIGNVLQSQGKYDEALARFRRALGIYEEVLGPEHESVASSLGNMGSVAVDQGEYDEAAGYYRRALSIAENAQGPTHLDVAYPLMGLATIALEGREFEEARAYAERAVAIREANPASAGELAGARFLLCRALWSDRSQRPRARALARQARDAFADFGPGAEDNLADVEAWLADNDPR